MRKVGTYWIPANDSKSNAVRGGFLYLYMWAGARTLAGNTEKAQVLQCYKKKKKRKEKERNSTQKVARHWCIYIYYVHHIHNNIYNVCIMGQGKQL